MTTVTTGTTSAATALVPVFTGTIQGQSVQLCEARALHAFMVVLRDFTNWIKGRIRKFGFVEGVDFIIIKLDSPDLANQKHGGDRKSVDYHLTLDMAKELSMVENNEKGREARRYFMACEKQVLAALSTSYAPPVTITPAQAQHLSELVDLVVESGRQKTHAETWKRFQRKMHVNSHKLLHPDQFDAACEYLHGKLEGDDIAALIQKHLPHAAPALPMQNALQALPSSQSSQTLQLMIVTTAIRASTETGAQWSRRLGIPESLVSKVRLHRVWKDYSSPFAGLGARA